MRTRDSRICSCRFFSPLPQTQTYSYKYTNLAFQTQNCSYKYKTAVTNTKLQLHLLKYLIAGAQILFHKSQIIELIRCHFCYIFCSKYGAKHICIPVLNNLKSCNESCTPVEYFLTNKNIFFRYFSSTNTSQELQLLESAATSLKCCIFRSQMTQITQVLFAPNISLNLVQKGVELVKLGAGAAQRTQNSFGQSNELV